MEVMSTTKYDMFSFEPANRPVDQRHLSVLKRSIEDKNLLHLFPIIVSKNFTVLDGQHRLTAAKELGVPIHYVVSDVASVTDMPGILKSVRRWTQRDFVEAWAKAGKSGAIEIKKLIEKYPFLRVETVLRCCYTGSYKSILSKLEDGSIDSENIHLGYKLGKYIEDYAELVPNGICKSPTFANALAYLIKHEDTYDHQTLIGRLSARPKALVPATKASDYVEILAEVFNYRAKIRVDWKMKGA